MTLSVVTGAASGIGRWIALGLARAGHDLVLIARSPERCAEAQAWIAARAPEARIEALPADLSHLSATREVARRIVEASRPVGVLVNNAGVFTPRRQETAEGHELTLAVNLLAPFVLTEALLPLLQQAAGSRGGARIVNIGSSTSDTASIDPDDLEGRRRWGRMHSYAQSKLALLMTTTGWAERLAGSGVVANTVHPGAVATGLVRAGGAIGLAWSVMRPFLLSEAQGADSPVHVALSPAFAAVSGAYVKKRVAVRPNRLALDASLRARVWAATERLSGP